MAMSELKQKLLLYELAKISFQDAQYHPISDRVQVQPDNDRMPTINDVGDIKYGTEYNSLAINTLRPLVDRVNEVAAAWEKSRIMPFEDLSQFRVLTEYNNIMLAARDDTVYGRGLHFVTWQYNYDHTGLDHGHYSEDYNAIKEDFAGRSGLIPAVKLFTPEQAAAIKASIDYRINNDGDLTYSTENALQSIAARLHAAYPEKDAHDNEEQEIESHVEAGKMMSAKNGNIQLGDWVIVTPNDDYGCLIGQVTDIELFGSLEHDTENLTDDIHVNFMNVEYSDERKDEIAEQLSALYGENRPFGMFALNDVIMAPDELIRISDAKISDIAYTTFEKLLDSREAAETYCNQVSQLIERLDANLANYRDSLMNFSKIEIIDMAGKIAAMTDVHRALTTSYVFDMLEGEHLLRYQNPLEVVADELQLQTRELNMNFVVFDALDKQNTSRGDYALVGSMEAHVKRLTEKAPEIRTPPEQNAAKQKRTLGEKLHAAGEKAKAQNAHDDNTESRKRDERS